MERIRFNAKLVSAILDEYGEDPHLGTPNPKTIEAIAEGVRLMCLAAKNRPASEANDSWDNLASYSSLMRARQCARGGFVNELPELAFAMLFLVFSHLRYQEDLKV
jgi:hypothetical protein